MMSFLVFQLWASFGIAVLTGIYYLLFRKETFYRFNRIYLVSSAIIAMILPAIHLAPFQSDKGLLPVAIKSVTVMAYKVYAPGIDTKETFHFLPLIYWTIALLIASYLVYQVAGVLTLIRRHTVIDEDGHKVVKLTNGTHTFSFFNLIFIPSDISSEAEYRQVVCHELAHANQFHSLDILLFRILKIVQWFNPFIYLMETLLKETHEYLADEAVLKQDSNAGQYRLLLLSQVFGVKPGLFSFFNHSLIKNRLTMMTKRKSPMRNRLKYLIVLPFLTLVIMVVCCNKSEQLAPPPPPPPPPPTEELSGKVETGNAEESFLKVEKPAQFQGGDIDAFRNWIQTKVVYPPEAIKNGIFGKVIVQFVVDSKGKLGDIKILRGVDPLLDNAALQALQTSPDWVPAKKDGKDIKQQFVIPVYFTLQ
jgi:TonB family protein